MPQNSANRIDGGNQWSNSLATKTSNITLAGCAAINGNIYTIGGYNGSTSSATEVYNISTNSWSTKATATYTTYNTAAAAAFTIGSNNYIYTFGGLLNGYGPLYNNFRYDISGNSWSPASPTSGCIADMPLSQTKRVHGACVTVGNYIWYIGGGASDYTGSTTIWRYDPGSGPPGTWNTSYTSMPGSGVWGHSIAAIGTKIYVLGGTASTGNATANLYSYETTTDTWDSTLPSAPVAFLDYNNQYLFAYGNYLYTLCSKAGAYNGSPSAGDRLIWRYDVAAKTWAIFNETPVNMTSQIACLVNDSIYILNSATTGGYVSSGTGIAYKLKLPIS